MTLGNRLKRLRGKRTQQDIAKILEISRSRYSHYENDFVQPDHELLNKMANLFEVSIDYLVTGKDNKNMPEWTEQDEKLLQDFNSLNEEDQKYILGFIEKLKRNS